MWHLTVQYEIIGNTGFESLFQEELYQFQEMSGSSAVVRTSAMGVDTSIRMKIMRVIFLVGSLTVEYIISVKIFTILLFIFEY